MVSAMRWATGWLPGHGGLVSHGRGVQRLQSGRDLRRLRLLRGLVVCPAFLLGACGQEGVLDPQGPIAAAERLLLTNATEIMLVVVVPVIVATLAFAWWYRASNPRAVRDPA